MVGSAFSMDTVRGSDNLGSNSR
ncbi:hypothetical protein Godav_028030 [Gossypium davidsonii]|uniref:Uncharacterized protein n=1 Tax=Gossypium davidsonii TaxID=34287 RepID=A0A7J8RY15_GOSDV|nr:hypothetical protein [Gossypium davidsonii]